jgi:glycosyltransferase involved in cell wall biosynthesis
MVLTIGVTCWNAEDSIIRALDSVHNLADEGLTYEVIIVDDASSDNSVSIIEQYIISHRLINFSLIQLQKNKGVAGVRSEILKHAKGEFFAFLDDDDEWLPARFYEQRQALLRAEQQCDFVLCYGSRLQKDLNGVMTKKSPIGYPEIVGGDVVKNFFCGGDKFGNASLDSAGTCVLFARLSTLKRLNGFDESFRRMEDLDFAIRHCNEGGVCVGTDAVVITQNITVSEDKGFDKELYYHKKLIRKHVPFFSLRFFYSQIKMHKSLSYKQGNVLRSKMYLLLSFLFSIENLQYYFNKAKNK